MNRSYVTTSIPYVNGQPHIGFALELVLADTAARFERLLGRETFLLTGTDENALKNVQAAADLGVETQELCDRNTAAFVRLADALGVTCDGFIRTSSKAHHSGASKFWLACRQDDFEVKSYTGLYCPGCEDFYEESDLEGGRCPTHGGRLERVAESNWFFRLSRYQPELEELLSSGRIRVVPETRRNEALAFVRRGLRDFSVSRPVERSGGWGVPVPGDPTQVIYVWFDALANYLTGLGYGGNDTAFCRFWTKETKRVHVIGKDILRFHAICWPALLLSAGLPVPDTILVHGFLTVEGEKISKSLGNAVDPLPLIDRYGADAVRYCLLKAIPRGADGDFSESRLRGLYASDLANGLGNLVSRVETLCERAEFVPAYGKKKLPEEVSARAQDFCYDRGLGWLIGNVNEINRQIEQERPWEALTQGDTARLSVALARWVDAIRTVGTGLLPFLPATGAEILRRFGGGEVRRGVALFPRLASGTLG